MKPLIVMFTGHCGSSWFLDILGAQPWCVWLGFEPFTDLVELKRADEIPSLARSLFLGSPLDAIRACDLLAPNKPIENQTAFCLKTRLDFDQKETFFDVLPKSNAVFVHLTRGNKLKAAISAYKRQHLGISHLENLDNVDQKRSPVHVDPEVVVAKAWEFIARDAMLYTYCNCLRQPVIRIVYEALCASPSNELRRVASAFGGQVQMNQSKYIKMTHDNIELSVWNYDELREFVSSNGLKHFLHSDIDTITEAYAAKQLRQKRWIPFAKLLEQPTPNPVAERLKLIVDALTDPVNS